MDDKHESCGKTLGLVMRERDALRARVLELEKTTGQLRADRGFLAREHKAKIKELTKDLKSETARANFLEQKAADNRLAQKSAEAKVEKLEYLLSCLKASPRTEPIVKDIISRVADLRGEEKK